MGSRSNRAPEPADIIIILPTGDSSVWFMKMIGLLSQKSDVKDQLLKIIAKEKDGIMCPSHSQGLSRVSVFSHLGDIASYGQ